MGKVIERHPDRRIGSGNHNNTPPTKLANRLRNLRVYAGMTQSEVGALVFRGYGSRVSDLENGIHIPSLRTLQLYATAFDTTVSRILDGVL